MSLEALTSVWSNYGIPRRYMMLMLALADYANSTGKSYPSVDTLAKKSRLSRRSIQDATLHLERLGFLNIELNEGQHGTNIYDISPAMKKGGGAESAPVQIGVQKSVHRIAPKPSGTIMNHQEPSVPSTPLPPKGDLFKVEKEQKAVIKKPLEIPVSLNTPDFKETWDEWVQFRRGLKKVPDFDRLFTFQLKFLAEYSVQTAIAIMDQSLRNGYTGLFELKTNGSRPKNAEFGQIKEVINVPTLSYELH